MRYISLLIAVLLLSKPAFSQSYSKNYLWGVAFSAHQTEGKAGGGENSDWYAFEHQNPSPIIGGDTADVADDFWNRYESDIELAAKLGINTIRTSVAWEKIEPTQGTFNKEVLAHYRKVFQSMKDRGLRPMIALHHFVNPLWFANMGGWANPESPKIFRNYAKVVINEFKDLCDLWISFNEPMMYVQMAYLKGEIPPLVKSMDVGFEAAFNLLRAHRMVAQVVHQVQGIPENSSPENILKGVGVAHAFAYFEPANPNSPADKKLVENMMESSNWAWLRAIDTGILEFKTPEKNFKKEVPASDLESGVVGPFQDWMGVNYYSKWLLKFNPLLPMHADWIKPQAAVEGDNGWPIDPKGLEVLPKMVSERFSIPIVITENGMADGNDSKRPQFIVDHLSVVDKVKSQGVDIRGYYHWTLMDNFEWLAGYSYQFGLVEVKFEDGLKRVPRKSFDVYKNEILKRNGKRDSLVVVLWNTQVSDQELTKYFDKYIAIGVKHVTLPVWGCQSSAQSSDVGSCVYQDPALSLRLAKMAKDRGLTVSFLPIVGTKTNEWRGQFEPADVKAWFENYTKWLMNVAQLSQDFAAPDFVVGTEFGSIYKHTLEWKKLIQEVRKVYQGRVVVTVNWNQSHMPQFFDAVDAIGVSAYHPLATSLSATYQDLLGNAVKHRKDLLKLSQQWKKPIHITELGYPSVKTGAMEPWAVAKPDAVVDLALQELCFKAFFEAWKGVAELIHVGLWGTTDWTDPNSVYSYEIVNKPAEKIIKTYFR